MAKRAKQLEFTGNGLTRPSDEFGGSLLKGNPKTKRPLESKMPIFLTLRAQKSWLRMPATHATVQQTIRSVAKKHGFKIYKQANVGNHLHLVLKMPTHKAWSAFIRELTGRIAQEVIERLGLVLDASFWKFRPHTRIIRGWRRAFKTALDYVFLNQLEADGAISRTETKSLSDLRRLWAGTG